MRVSELLEVLNKMHPDAQVMLCVNNTEESTVRAVSVQVEPYSCVIRDHVIQRHVHVVKLRGVEYEEVPDWKVTLNNEYGTLGGKQ